jgi:hypothetical protein
MFSGFLLILSCFDIYNFPAEHFNIHRKDAHFICDLTISSIQDNCFFRNPKSSSDISF